MKRNKRRGKKSTGVTEHSELCDLALPLSNHVCSNADVLPRVALLGVGDHQLAAANLKHKYSTSASVLLTVLRVLGLSGPAPVSVTVLSKIATHQFS